MRTSFLALGLNHQSAPVDVREAFELTEPAIREMYSSISLAPGSEIVLLSTCNRTEAWLYGTRSDAETVRTAFEARAGDWPSQFTFLYEHEEAIRHILEVVSGLRSQILGDGQILSQVKAAYRLSHQCECAGPHLHRLMHAAFANAKLVISSTALRSGAPSVAKAAVDAVRERISFQERRFSDLTILVLGCGGMGIRVLKELASNPPARCFVTNRTDRKADLAAEKYGAIAVPWAQRNALLGQVDIVFVATGAPEFVVTSTDFPDTGSNRGTLVVDISVPRNVDPVLGDRSGIELFNIDELSTVNSTDRSARRRDIEKAQGICNLAVAGALKFEEERSAVEPAVCLLQETFESIRRREVERNIHRFAPQDQEHVDRLTRSIMQKVLAIPVVRIKRMANGETDLTERLELLRLLFDRSECEE